MTPTTDHAITQTEAPLDDPLTHPKFIELCNRVSGFNVFDVLGLVTYELRHTKTLAWLLDPQGSHELGSMFQRLFFEGLYKDFGIVPPGNPEYARVFSELLVKKDQPLMLDDDDAESLLEDVLDSAAGARRSGPRIDVYLQIDKTYFVAIEAKLGASEHGDQLVNYREAVERHAASHPASTKAFLYLTLDGATPERKDEAGHWKSITWGRHVVPPLRAVAASLCTNAASASSNIAHFIRDYLGTLEKVTGAEEYAPRVLADQLLRSNGAASLLKAIERDTKTGLSKRLKRQPGGVIAAKLLVKGELAHRAKLCRDLAHALLDSEWDRLNHSDTTSVDFATGKMRRLTACGNPPFYFKLEVRKETTIELKLFFEPKDCQESPERLATLHKHLLKWPDHPEWNADVFTRWGLGDTKAQGDARAAQLGNKMAALTFGKPVGVIRTMPDDRELARIKSWLASVVLFVDRRIEEMLVERDELDARTVPPKAA